MTILTRYLSAGRRGNHNGSRETALRLFTCLLLVLPCLASAQPHERFSVVPGDDSGLVGIGTVLQTDFRFVADVTNAKCYELDYGDGEVDRGIRPESDGRKVLNHRYKNPGRYWATMTAWRLRAGEAEREVDCANELRDLAEPIALRLRIVVRAAEPGPPPPPSVAIFSAAPSDPDDPTAGNDEVTWADFTFTAFVTGATRYQLSVDENVTESGITLESSGGAVRHQHRYEKPGVYTAILTAQRGAGEPVELRQKISVTAPAAAVPQQWPRPRSPAVPPVERGDPDMLPWLLLGAVLIAAALSRAASWGQTGLVTFAATTRQGEYAVNASTDAVDAVSIRVQSESPQYVISGTTKIEHVRPGTIDKV